MGQWIEEYFNEILDEYGALKYNTVLGGGVEHARRKNHVRMSPKILAYFKMLNLSDDSSSRK